MHRACRDVAPCSSGHIETRLSNLPDYLFIVYPSTFLPSFPVVSFVPVVFKFFFFLFIRVIRHIREFTEKTIGRKR